MTAGVHPFTEMDFEGQPQIHIFVNIHKQNQRTSRTNAHCKFTGIILSYNSKIAYLLDVTRFQKLESLDSESTSL